MFSLEQSSLSFSPRGKELCMFPVVLGLVHVVYSPQGKSLFDATVPPGVVGQVLETIEVIQQTLTASCLI